MKVGLFIHKIQALIKLQEC